MFGWNHTLSVRNGPAVVAKCCSFEATPLKEGQRCSVHKAKLLDPLENNTAVVKVFYIQDSNFDSKEAEAEVKKSNFAGKVLRQCSKTAKESVQLARTFESHVDKVGKTCKLKKKMSKARHRHVSEGVPVVVQDFVDGRIRELFSLTENYQTSSCQTSQNSPCLLELVRTSYSLSRGRCVIGAIKGVVVVPERKGRGRVTFYLTSLTIHSRGQEYGEKDLGVLGVEMYERWSGLTTMPPPLPASAPPLEVFFADVDETPQTLKARSVFPWPPSQQGWSSMEDCMAPQHPSGLSSLPGSGPCVNNTNKTSSSFSSSSRDSVDNVDGGRPQGPRELVRRRTLADVLATTPELRTYYPEDLLTRILGPVPDYSSCNTVS